MTGGLPDFLVIGAQKSGTTTLADRLAADPRVHLPDAEAHFFSHRFDRGLDWYRRTLAGAPPCVVIGEKSPSYLTDPAAPARIADALPDVRLLAVLRDPVDRAYSHYWHNRRLAKESLSFSEAIAVEAARVATAETTVERERYGYAAGGRYVEHLARFDARFEGRLLVLVFEDLRSDQAAVVDEARQFLGLGPASDRLSGAGDPVVRNAFVTYRSQRLRRFARRLPRPMAAAVFRLNRRTTSYPPLDPGLRRELAAEFRTGDDELALRLGRPLPWTSQQGTA